MMRVATKDEEKLFHIKELKKSLKKDFGRNPCKDLSVECARCKATLLISYLEWYEMLLDYDDTRTIK